MVKRNEDNKLIFDTPTDYFDIINDFVVGQEDLKKTLSVCCYRHTLLNESKNYRPHHLLIAGPSGTGKTFSITTLLENINIPYTIFDSSTVTVTGYVGATFDSAVTFLYNSTGNNISKTEKGVIVFDEIDKLFSSFDNPREDVTRLGAQNELLRLLEGNTIQIQTSYNEDPIFVNTAKILFIFLGSFNNFKDILYGDGNGLYETKKDEKKKYKIDILEFPNKLLKCGLSTELVGRINYFSQTFPLTKEEIKKTIKSVKNPIIDSYEKYLAFFSISIDLDDSFINHIVEKSEFEKFGVRRIPHLLNHHLFELMYKIDELKQKYKSVIVKYNTEEGVYFEFN